MNLSQLYDIFQREWGKYQSIYLISDTHFNDEELAAGVNSSYRTNPDEYVRLINSKVGKNDVLIHLGDCGDLSYIRKLKAGHKVLIMGNHDSGKTNYEHSVKYEIFEDKNYNKEKILAEMQAKYPDCSIHIDGPRFDTDNGVGTYYVAKADNRLFDTIFQGPIVIGEKLLLSHEPIHGVDCFFNIHGHCHDPKAKDNAHHMNICPDATGNFEPINFNHLLKNGIAAKVETKHRDTINRATAQKRKRRKK